MVFRKNLNKKYALVSVYDKTNLRNICKVLKENSFYFISTGSTHKIIKSYGYNCIDVKKITKFKEMFDGRVKTLDYKLYGSILHDRNNRFHLRELNKLNIPSIDLVVVNLYPFKKFLKENNEDKVINMIDIGGHALLRSSSKNYKHVTSISNIKDYPKLIKNLRKNNGVTDLNFRKEMALESFKITSDYDSLIRSWFADKSILSNKKTLKYGENPNQFSYIINKNKKSIFEYQLNENEISYNNVIDIDSGIKCLNEFKEPTCIIIKHNNPCGVASSNNIDTAFRKAYECDSKSSFGGIVLLNRKIKVSLAKLLTKYFFELIVATEYDINAIEELNKKKKINLFKIGKIKFDKNEFRSTVFGTVYQNRDTDIIKQSFCKLVASKKLSKRSFEDILYSLKVAKHLKSNAIVLCHNKQTLGIGNGQTSRVDSVDIALRKYKKNFKNKKFVCASDGFFPFIDSLKLLKKNGCIGVAQPSGSINDKKIINYCIDNNLPLYFIKNRLFKH